MIIRLQEGGFVRGVGLKWRPCSPRKSRTNIMMYLIK